MSNRPYYMAHSCPHCGQKDAPEAWRGARMTSSTWGHDFCCCSDECGKAFKVTYDDLMRNRTGRKKLVELWHRLQSESDSRLSLPYEGYPWRK